MINNSSIYIVEVSEDGDKFVYEYGNIKYAEEHFNNEKISTIYEYNEGKYYFVKSKWV